MIWTPILSCLEYVCHIWKYIYPLILYAKEQFMYAWKFPNVLQKWSTNCISCALLCLFVYLHDFPQEGRVVLFNDRFFSVILCCLLGSWRDGKGNQSLKENSTDISSHMFSGVMMVILYTLYTNYTFTFHLDWIAS